MNLRGGFPGESSKPAFYPQNRAGHTQHKWKDEHKEMAWAFLGLILWSAVVIGGLLGAGHVLGHYVLHLW